MNVVDDIEMAITHVIRGEDHLSNTPKHLQLYRALGAEPPRFGHIPLILNTDGSKMSKRDQGASVTSYIEGGYAPEAVRNYLCLLGWSPKDDREIAADRGSDRALRPRECQPQGRASSISRSATGSTRNTIQQMPMERYRELAQPWLDEGGNRRGRAGARCRCSRWKR